MTVALFIFVLIRWEPGSKWYEITLHLKAFCGKSNCHGQAICILMILTSSPFLAFGQTDDDAKEPTKTMPRPTPTPSAAKAEPFDKADVKAMAAQCVTFDTEAGVIEMEMFPEHAESVRNFLNLAATGLFDTTVFGRVVPGFVIQGGDLYSREGKVTYEIGMRACRSLPDEPNKVLHERGVLSMARGDEANSATTSFFHPGRHRPASRWKGSRRSAA